MRTTQELIMRSKSKKIVRSIEEFGFINPVLIDGNFGIIAGHGRVMAAKKMGMTEVPCLFVEDLTEAQKRAYIIADNKLALDAGWDEELLHFELAELQDMDFDITLTGFDVDDLYEDELQERKDISETLKEEFKLIIDCVDETSLQELYERLSKEGYECRISTL